MGTSVNQPSPNTGGWRAVSACYSTENISVERTALEIWRAASKQDNTLVGEFAKRMLMVKASGGAPGDTPIAALFRQLTDYYVSRDVPGFVGANFRCKTISELRHFKQQIADAVS